MSEHTKYGVVLADPPWQFKAWSPKGTGRSAEQHYSVMSTGAIANLNVADIAADNAALFLWAVWPMLPAALEVMDAWGFTYRTVAWVWVKQTPSGMGFHTGLGYYTRANTEPCLFGVRGRMPVAVHDEVALIVSPVRAHSQKPHEQYRKIERLYPDARKIELFARCDQHPAGWDTWGNECPMSVTLHTSEDSRG